MKERSDVSPEAVHKEFRSAFGKVMAGLAEHRGISLRSDVTRRAEEIISTIFEDNPARVSYEFSDVDVGKASTADVGFAIATQLSQLILTNAYYEGRKEIRLGDVYLALLDVQKGDAWPWP